LHSAERIKQIETTTNHDLKSVEYFIKENISHYNEYVHFCCTSEDINNLAYSLMLKDSLKSVVITKMTDVLQSLINKSESWGSHAMLAHTHGQAASPTTLGKEFANFAYRLANSLGHLKRTKIFGKFNGAVGNYNAHYFAYPNLNWR
jgi:adenylosuccinate lyase